MATLLERIAQTNIYIQPIFFVLIVTTNLLNIYILRSSALRSSPCSYYFLAYSIFSIAYIICLCLSQLLRYFSIPWVDTSTGCRLGSFCLFTLVLQASLALALASIDRYCSSSTSIRLRSFSNKRTAKLIIFISTFLCVFYTLPLGFIYHYDVASDTCLTYSDIMASIYTISQLVIYYILVPLIMITAGFFTILNIRQQRNRIAPIIVFNRNRRTEGQLARMLLLQVGVRVLLSLPYAITYIMMTFIPTTQSELLIAIQELTIDAVLCDYFIFFFLNILSGSIYRQRARLFI